jgi:hypothetical protein
VDLSDLRDTNLAPDLTETGQGICLSATLTADPEKPLRDKALAVYVSELDSLGLWSRQVRAGQVRSGRAERRRCGAHIELGFERLFSEILFDELPTETVDLLHHAPHNGIFFWV